jgi:hypothetical protein
VSGAAALPSSLALADGDDVVIAETFYTFVPLLSNQLLATNTLYKVAYFKPRLGALSSYTSSCS